MECQMIQTVLLYVSYQPSKTSAQDSAKPNPNPELKPTFYTAAVTSTMLLSLVFNALNL